MLVCSLLLKKNPDTHELDRIIVSSSFSDWWLIVCLAFDCLLLFFFLFLYHFDANDVSFIKMFSSETLTGKGYF